jgi:hypothetical protein
MLNKSRPTAAKSSLLTIIGDSGSFRELRQLHLNAAESNSWTDFGIARNAANYT